MKISEITFSKFGTDKSNVAATEVEQVFCTHAFAISMYKVEFKGVCLKDFIKIKIIELYL